MTRKEKEIELLQRCAEDPAYYIREMVEGIDDDFLDELLGIEEEDV